MKKLNLRWRITIVGIATLVLSIAGLGPVPRGMFRPREPDPPYAGKPLSFWVGTYFAHPSNADAAVRQAGTNALPLLLRFMRAHDSHLKKDLIAILNKPYFEKLGWSLAPEDMRKAEATQGFLALGPTGQQAVPELMRIYEMNLSELTQECIISILGSIGPSAKQSIPMLVRVATTGKSGLNVEAAYALSQMSAVPQVAVPVLKGCLNSSNDYTQIAGVLGLGNFGPEARTAIPDLLALYQSLPTASGRSELTPEMIEKALKQISPQTAARADGER